MLLTLLVVTSAKRAIVTLLSGAPANAEKYVRLLHYFVYSLRNAGYEGEIAVMHTKDYPINHERLARLLNVRLIPVEKISIPHNKKNAHYATMLTKLHIWNLTEYEQVIYYDCDFVFQHNPESAFAACSWSNLCATPDTGITKVDHSIVGGSYFNGGFLVVRPNKKIYEDLMSKRSYANDRPFVEQDYLNYVYKNKWGKLDNNYNLMHCYLFQKISTKVIAIHEKMWILRKSFPQRGYIWNSSKMQINYPITDVLGVPGRSSNQGTGSSGSTGQAMTAGKPLNQAQLQQVEFLRKAGLVEEPPAYMLKPNTVPVIASASTTAARTTTTAGFSGPSTTTATSATTANTVNTAPIAPTTITAKDSAVMLRKVPTLSLKPNPDTTAEQYERAQRRYREQKRREAAAARKQEQLMRRNQFYKQQQVEGRAVVGSATTTATTATTTSTGAAVALPVMVNRGDVAHSDLAGWEKAPSTRRQ